jgi:hypothetical protein
LRTVYDNKIKTLNLTDPVVIGDSYVTTQVSKADDASLEESYNQAVMNKLAVVNVTSCISKLKSYYNLTNATDLVVIKYDMDKQLLAGNANATFSNSLSFDFYDPHTNAKLNRSICDSYEVKMPFDRNNTAINMSLYKDLKNQSIDVYNPNDTAFTSRCTSIIDPATGYSTTLNYRRNNYFQNKSISCGNGCTYKNIDQNDYVVCQCDGVTQTDSELINNLGDLFLGGFTNINLGIIVCYDHTFVNCEFNF